MILCNGALRNPYGHSGTPSQGNGNATAIEAMAAGMAREKELEMVNVFRNVMVTGALLGFARFVAKDKRIIGQFFSVREAGYIKRKNPPLPYE